MTEQETKSGAEAPDCPYVPCYKLICNPTGNTVPLDRGTPELRLRWLRATKLLLEALELMERTEQDTNEGSAEMTFLPTWGNE
jgi:hypothetical protein